MKKLLAIIICNMTLLCITYGQWREVNNGLFGGHIGGLFVDPVTNLLFAGTENCGIFVTSDNGQHWKTSNNGLPDKVYNVESFVRSGNNLFAACSFIEGVFLSTDNGKTWVNKKNGFPDYTSVHCLALSGTKIFAGTATGVFLTLNNGDSWTPVNNGLTQMSQYVNSMAAKGENIFAGTLGGIFVSTDDGGNWSKLNLGLEYEFIQTIAIDEGNIYAGAPLGKFCISSDNGISWTVVNTGLPFGVDFKYLAVGNSIIYGGTTGGGVCISNDNGITWKQFNNVLFNKSVNKLAIKGNKIFAATEAGVFLSTDNCSSWTEANNGLTNIVVTSIVQSSGRLIAGTRGTGLYSSTNNGNTWSASNMGFTVMSPYIQGLMVNGNYVFAGTMDGLFVSEDNGVIWEKPNLNLPYNGNIVVDDFALIGDKIFAATSNGLYVSVDNGKSWTTNNALKSEGLYSLAVSGNNLFAGTFSGIYLSTDNGNNWVNINNGLSLTDNCIWSIVTKDDKVFFGCYDGVFVSSDNGSSWTAVNNGIPHLNVYALALSGNNLFAGTYNDGVFLSTNNGNSWTPVNGGLRGPALVTSTLSVIGDDIYAGTNKGIWKHSLSDLLSLSVSPGSLNIAALENSKATFNITSNTDWNVTSCEGWLTLSKASGSGDATIDLIVSQNNSKEPRKATVTVSGFGVHSQSILVTQEGKKDKVKKNDIIIYPNPATDHLTLTIGESYDDPDHTIKIMNVLGKVVFETKITQSQYEVNVSSWKMKGAYVLQVYNNCKKVVLVKTIIVK